MNWKRKNICDIDKSAGFFGRIMAELFVCREDEWAEKLRKMGFYFGKFIYLMDAYEDIEEDLKQNRYNPLAELYGQESFEENCQQILKMMMAETSVCLNSFPLWKRWKFFGIYCMQESGADMVRFAAVERVQIKRNDDGSI